MTVKFYKTMLIIVTFLMFALAVCSVLSAVDRELELSKTFDHAMVFFPDGDMVEGKVTSWKNFADSDQVQVEIDGKTYLVHSRNIVLVSE